MVSLQATPQCGCDGNNQHGFKPALGLSPGVWDCDQVCGSGSGTERRDALVALPALDSSRGVGTLWDPVEEGASVGISGHVSGQPSPLLIPS